MDGMGGMMGGQGSGMMGSGGMMGGQGTYYESSAKPIGIARAAEAARNYVNGYGPELHIAEVMEFAWNYYAEVEEEDGGVHAMELLVDKYTGAVSPEPGPNMMWNTKYSMMSGMMGGYRSGATALTMPVSPEQAKEVAQHFLDANVPGLTMADADTFYGYYTLHTLKDGQVEGMLSVNGYTGAVWHHTWHGPFVGMEDYE